MGKAEIPLSRRKGEISHGGKGEKLRREVWKRRGTVAELLGGKLEGKLKGNLVGGKCMHCEISSR